MSQNLTLVAGGGGFIGGHLVGALLDQGREVRSVDIKPEADWYQVHGAADNVILDLRDAQACHDSARGRR